MNEDGGGGPPGPTVHVRAPAKVNLVLRVLDRDRATGYHRLETLFQAVDLSDRLSVEVVGGRSGESRAGGPPPGVPRPEEVADVELHVRGADLGPPDRNLATRAAGAFLRRVRDGRGPHAGATGAGPASLPDVEAGPGRVGCRLRIRLEKHIPAGAGLGGGSSDAAATLRGLNRLFDEPLQRSDLHELGAALGSDVPFFLGASPTALGRGRGDRLRPLPVLSRRPVLLVLPGVHVSTAEAYASLARARAAKRQGSRRSARDPRAEQTWGRGWETVARDAVNDFEAVVPEEYPPVRRALEALRKTSPLIGLLSGSGSAVFGVYGSDSEATGAAEELERGGHTVVASRTLDAFPAPYHQP